MSLSDPARSVTLSEFLEPGSPIFDVRTPAEFLRGHIPGAHNLPLFDDAQRVTIGTSYKQQGRHQAILEGLDRVGPRMRGLIEQVRAVVGEPGAGGEPAPLVRVHCWRGGMRSQSVAWLLGFYGYRCQVLEGGYKAFRHGVLEAFTRPRQLLLLGGSTGSGKTRLLHGLLERGEPIVDLEGLAAHRGSAFGALDMPPQPSQEHFENLLAMALSNLDPERPVWLEDESRRIGALMLPAPLWQQMTRAPICVVRVPMDRRVSHLLEIYGKAARQDLVDSFVRIRKRLGGEAMARAIAHIDAGELDQAARLALDYYDRTYGYGLEQRAESPRILLDPALFEGVDPEADEARALDAIIASGRQLTDSSSLHDGSLSGRTLS